MKIIKEFLKHNSSYILSIYKIAYNRYKLTKRLNIGQKSILLFIVHKKYFDYIFILILLQFFFQFCTSSKINSNSPFLLENYTNCDLPPYILFDPSYNKNSIVHIINEDHKNWIYETKTNIEILQKKIQLLKTLSKKQPECLNPIIQYLDNERFLMMKLLNLYYRNLELYFINYLSPKEHYKKNEILEDFLENKKAIIESVNQIYYHIHKLISIDPKDTNLAKKIEKEIQTWHQTYYILTYDLFYQLPKEFKKEWFKKFKF